MSQARTILAAGLTALVGAGCGPDPILDEADQERAREDDHSTQVSRPPGSAIQPPPGAPTQPTRGIPEEPQPGQPDTPDARAGVPGAPGAPVDGPQVTLKGEVRYGDYKDGKVRVDVFDGDQRNFSKHPGVVGWVELAGPGPYEVQVPQAAERVWLSAYNDANNDGKPGHEDPTGYLEDNPVGLEDSTITGLDIELEYNPRPEGQ